MRRPSALCRSCWERHLDTTNLQPPLQCPSCQGCIYFYAARIAALEGKAESSWVGQETAAYRFEGKEGWVGYFYSFYLSCVIFAGFGDNDFYPANPAETIITIM